MKPVIVDDHPLLRLGIRNVLDNSELEIEMIEEAGSATELLNLLSKETADIVLLDIGLPGRNGIDLLNDLEKMYPELPALVLSAYPEDRFALRALKAGAAGYLNKLAVQTELVKAIRTIVCKKKRYINAEVADLLAEQVVDETEGRPHEQLSDREFQVMSLIANGKKVREIAEVLSLSVQTIHTYRRRLMRKMDMDSNAELIRYALENELVV